MPHASRTRIVKLTKWFPPNDPLAAKVARLCILREDFLLEMNGVYTEQIKLLDGHSEEWRKLYFIRNLVRTLREIESGIHMLMSDPQFKVLLAAQEPERQKEFAEHIALMNKAIKLVNEVRNEICGHVLETAVQETLIDISGSDVFGFLEIGPTLRRTYFRFAGELIIQMLVRGVRESDKENAFMEKWEKISGLFNSFALVERVLNIYATDRRLLG